MWFDLARKLVAEGALSPAQAVMVKAAECGCDIWSLDDFTLIDLGLQALGEGSARIAEMTKPCPVLGRAGAALDPVAEALITTQLDQHLQSFNHGGGQAPILPASDYPLPALPFRILTIFGIPKPGEKITDIPDGYENTARACGFEVMRFAFSNDLIYDLTQQRPGDVVNAALAEFDLALARFKPHLVVLDGNFIGHHGTIRPEHFAERAAWNYRLMVVIPDSYDTQPNFFDYWGSEADLLVYLNRRTTHIEASQWRAKGLYWPGVPLPADLFDPYRPDQKTKHVGLIGTLNRGRELFQKYFEAAQIDGHYRLHNRKDHMLSNDEYRTLTAQSRIILNTGVISANHRIVTLRVFETVYANALLLDESGSEIDQLYVPFVHYLPFANVHQAIKLTQYMIRHEDRRAAMIARARAWTNRYFAAEKFWCAALGRLGF